MPLTIRNLGFGQVINTTETILLKAIYQTQIAKSLLVKNVMLTNTGSGEASLLLYFKQGGAEYQIAPKPLLIPAGSQVILDSEISLFLNQATPEVICGKFSAGSGTVQFVTNGIERDI
jgi:hypothetical protein